MNKILLEITDLREQIRKYDIAYYAQGKSIISDFEYDTLYKKLVDLEKSHPEFITPESPTQRVGNDLASGFDKVTHKTPMMSIDNTYSINGLIEWTKRISKSLNNESISYICEHKLDGVAVSLHYEDGILVRGVTRGNGVVGDDITQNIKTIKSIPLSINQKGYLEIRGEIYMTFDNFIKLNNSLIEDGKKAMQNPRNTVSGTIKLLDSKEVSKRNLSFAAHYLLSTNIELKNHFENLESLKKNGIPVVYHSDPMTSVDDLISFVKTWEYKKQNLQYPADGIVIKVNNLNQQKKLGTTSKSPRWVIAFKYQPEQAITIVESIIAQVGRTGVVTPVAKLAPIKLAGTIIQNATLHNYDEIERLDVRISDTVTIEKSGEIIPKIINVIKDKRKNNVPKFLPPKKCPSCNSELIRLGNEVALRCLNTSCFAKIFASLNHFVSRSAMNIEGLGPAIIKQLLESQLVKTPADIYKLTIEQLSHLERMGNKSALNLVNSINGSKNNSLDKLIHGLGIRMVGSQASGIIARYVDDISDLYEITSEELTQIESIGETIAESIKLYFSRLENQNLIEELRKQGVNCKGIKSDSQNQIFKDKIFVLTGTLENFTRLDAKKEIELRGGKVTSSVSKKTTYVVAGREAGSKLRKAETLNIKILSENDLIEMMNKDQK